MTYADSSVIVKRYYEELGSERVREGFAATERIFTSRLAYAEVHAALARKRRERALSEGEYRRSASAFEADWPSYDQISTQRHLAPCRGSFDSTRCVVPTRFIWRPRSGSENRPAIRSSCGRPMAGSWRLPAASTWAP